ncbi:2-succinyl-6-hydroxy-2,4-cyclohexadiene-1-carboxylate synthase [Bacillus massiliglaciei]|uniref:2-succinyl-6-hydroxy-2, 4-cyclohexadiene-1-carboxylate synthase n=1 Tax=Bacillus massiliglaciei TaxID=1816693 RepID=UPI002D21BD48|nr:2-succinyl-6-hydroxy-2,4-cyclohexadiene-1-carboxylate synthase [Bacillus massiliglaciei]
METAGTGEPLVLLHGFTGSKETWNFLIPELSRDYCLIMPDIIGHGETESPENPARYEMKEAANDLKCILAELGYESAHFLGYSMGGRLALSFSCYFPECVRSLILESASPGLETEREREQRIAGDAALAEKIEKNGILEFVNQWENISLFETQKRLPDEIRQAVRRERLGNHITGLSNSLRGMGTGSQPSWWKQLSELPFSVLMITGELDLKFCKIAERMNLSLKNGRIATINDTGHAIHVENPQKFGKIVSEFLKNH